jgi:nitrite reductase/ring-hydroxylating ferredoxin subunit
VARFVAVARADELPPGAATVVEVDGHEVALVHAGGRFFALDNLCPHNRGPLGEGKVVGDGALECPWHGSTFDVRTGRVLDGPAKDAVRTYAVQAEDGVVRVAFDTEPGAERRERLAQLRASRGRPPGRAEDRAERPGERAGRRRKGGQGQWAFGYYEPLNATERVKRDQDGLDVYERIVSHHAKEGYASISEADYANRYRWYGLYTQRPEEDGFFMMRIRVPNGVLTAEQVVAVGRISQRFGRDVCDVTDRQNFQLHWIRIEDVPEIWARLGAVGLTTRQTCGDVTRNIIGCPLAGVAADEVLDATPYVFAVDRRLTGTQEFSNLPRKYKISISGCREQCAVHEVMDIGMAGVELPDGRRGFDLSVGGGLGPSPHFGQRLGAFIPPARANNAASTSSRVSPAPGRPSRPCQARKPPPPPWNSPAGTPSVSRCAFLHWALSASCRRRSAAEEPWANRLGFVSAPSCWQRLRARAGSRAAARARLCARRRPRRRAGLPGHSCKTMRAGRS